MPHGAMGALRTFTRFSLSPFVFTVSFVGERWGRPSVGCYSTAAGWYLPSLAPGLARAGCGFQSCGFAYGVTSQFSLESFQSAMMTNVPELFVYHSLRSCFHFQQPTVGNVRSCWKYPFQFRQVLCGWMDVAADIGHRKQSQLV